MKVLRTTVGVIVGIAAGFVLYNLLRAVFGSTWSTAEGGPWLVIYSPFIILAAVGGVVGFFKKIKTAIKSVIVTLVSFFAGGLVVMLVAGMFIGGGAIYAVVVVGVITSVIVTMNTIVK